MSLGSHGKDGKMMVEQVVLQVLWWDLGCCLELGAVRAGLRAEWTQVCIGVL